MKFVTTAQPYRQLVIEQDEDGTATKVVGRTPLEVSNEDAARIVKLGEANGVAINVTDEADLETAAGTPQGGVPVAQPAADLSAGVGSIHGSGAPVTNDTVTGDDKPATKSTKGGN